MIKAAKENERKVIVSTRSKAENLIFKSHIFHKLITLLFTKMDIIGNYSSLTQNNWIKY